MQQSVGCFIMPLPSFSYMCWLICYSPFGVVGWLMGYVQSQELDARAPRLPRFILLGSFSDTLLVVFILDMIFILVYDCHL